MSITNSWSHVRLKVADIDRSVQFYTDVFGFEQIFDLTMEGPEFDALLGVEGASSRCLGGQVGDMRLEFNCTSGYPQTPVIAGMGMVGITFQVQDALWAHEQCLRRGLTTSGPPTDLLGCRIFFVDDPDGVRIEIVEYQEGTPAWGGQGARPGSPPASA